MTSKIRSNIFDTAALIIIDVQQGFSDPRWGKRNNPNAESNIALILERWRKTKRPLYHIKHDATEPNSTLRADRPGNKIKDIVAPKGHERVITKTVNSALIGTPLEAELREYGTETLVIVGLTTDHCISTTVRMAGNLGFTVYVVSDATATFERHGFNGKHYTAEAMHEHALVSLQDEFATITTTEEVVKD